MQSSSQSVTVRVIAEISDYAIAVQFIGESFTESIGNDKRYTHDRIKIIDKHGMIAPKDLAKVTGVSVAAISQWMKPLVEKGILIWGEKSGDEFSDITSLEKAKRSGKALIKVAGFSCLPTPFEITGNPAWDIEGELYRQYDFGFESTDTDVLDLDEGEQSSLSLNTSVDSYDVENKEEPEVSTEGVKALRSIPHKDIIKKVAELKENQEEYDPKDPELIKFQNDLIDILTPENVCAIN